MSEAIKLHIGGWKRSDGWKILDALPGAHVDYVGNCNDLSFLPDASCSDIYASHVIEHLGYDGEIVKTLKGFYRVLQPGGMVRISVPDLDMLCQLFVHPAATTDHKFQIMRMMFGGRTTEFDVHYAGLNFEILGSFMQQAGFAPIQRVENFGLFRDTSEMLFHGAAISLNMTGKKPG